MASAVEHAVPDLEKRPASHAPSDDVDEKKDVSVTESVVVDTQDGDEALALVGRDRQAHFSDEYNRRLRRKLVSNPLYMPCPS